MEQEKFQERVLKQINKSLPVQHINGSVKPLELLKHRDRYFLVRCKLKSGTKPCVFLRYDKWYFYLHGLKSIPKEYKRRDYDFKTRSKGKLPDPKAEARKKKIQERKIKLADKMLKEVKRTSRIIRDSRIKKT
jgi:hypothetical protein